MNLSCFQDKLARAGSSGSFCSNGVSPWLYILYLVIFMLWKLKKPCFSNSHWWIVLFYILTSSRTCSEYSMVNGNVITCCDFLSPRVDFLGWSSPLSFLVNFFMYFCDCYDLERAQDPNFVFKNVVRNIWMPCFVVVLSLRAEYSFMWMSITMTSLGMHNDSFEAQLNVTVWEISMHFAWGNRNLN